MKNQKESDIEIQELMGEYFKNKSNSVSGWNFKKTVVRLLAIQHEWLTQSVTPYLVKSGLSSTKSIYAEISGSPMAVTSSAPAPEIVGHLNRDYGYRGFDKIAKGSPIYSSDGVYYFEMRLTGTDNIQRQKFHKENLSPHIEFIKTT